MTTSTDPLAALSAFQRKIIVAVLRSGLAGYLPMKDSKTTAAHRLAQNGYLIANGKGVFIAAQHIHEQKAAILKEADRG